MRQSMWACRAMLGLPSREGEVGQRSLGISQGALRRSVSWPRVDQSSFVLNDCRSAASYRLSSMIRKPTQVLGTSLARKKHLRIVLGPFELLGTGPRLRTKRLGDLFPTGAHEPPAEARRKSWYTAVCHISILEAAHRLGMVSK